MPDLYQLKFLAGKSHADHGAGSSPHHLLGRASEEDVIKPGSPVGPHDDQIRLLFPGGSQDFQKRGARSCRSWSRCAAAIG